VSIDGGTQRGYRIERRDRITWIDRDDSPSLLRVQ
jgi:hypothetical protein